jgi:deoxyadenosine/deoxycytidine kinase
VHNIPLQHIERKYPSYLVVHEPIDIMAPFLKQFLENPQLPGAAYRFQCRFLVERALLLERLLRAKPEHEVVVLDGHPVCDRICFVEPLVSLGLMTEAELADYQRLSEYVCLRYPTPSRLLTLDATNERLLANIVERNRPGEHHYTVDYFDRQRRGHMTYRALMQELRSTGPAATTSVGADTHMYTIDQLDQYPEMTQFAECVLAGRVDRASHVDYVESVTAGDRAGNMA